MRTTLDIDEGLLRDVLRLTGERSKSRAVNKALEDYLRSARLRALLDAPGRILLDEDWRSREEAELSE